MNRNPLNRSRELAVFLLLFASAFTVAQPTATRVIREVIFEVDLRDEVAAGRFDVVRDRIGLRGAAKPLSWDRAFEAERVDASDPSNARFRAVVRFERPAESGQLLQYKWRIERPGLGSSEGWEDGRNRTLALDSARQTVSRKFNAPPDPIALQRTGRIDRIAVTASDASASSASPSAITGASAGIISKHVSPRGVQVWLPPSYEREPHRRFPVLYLHDGQAVFDAAMAGAEWQMDEAAQRMIERGEIAPFIMVAVDNSQRRFDEYTPTRARMPAERTGTGRAEDVGGGAPAYARFLVEELKPEIDRRYRTLAAREHTSVGGASLGGLLSLWFALHHADTFGAALVVSPSVWWDDRVVLRDVARATIRTEKRAKLWLDMGANESAAAIPNVRALRDALRERGWRDADLRYTEDPEGSHDEASWALRVPDMLRFLFPMR
jgi:predicted alpha/beta superfamily hydrolase